MGHFRDPGTPRAGAGTGRLVSLIFPFCPTPLYIHPSSSTHPHGHQSCLQTRGYYSPSSSLQFTHSTQLSKEYVAMQKEPPPFVWAAPDEKDILICAPSPLSRHDLKLIPFSFREFYHRTTAPPAFDALPRLTHHTLSFSTVHQSHPTWVASTMEYSFSPQNTRSSHQVSRSVALFKHLCHTLRSSARRCSPRLVAFNLTRRSAFPCLISILALYVQPSLLIPWLLILTILICLKWNPAWSVATM